MPVGASAVTAAGADEPLVDGVAASNGGCVGCGVGHPSEEVDHHQLKVLPSDSVAVHSVPNCQGLDLLRGHATPLEAPHDLQHASHRMVGLLVDAKLAHLEH
eukprot:CAMPEP_0197629822 /NCGR_PEP_ID=MMETSP1338-20131121/7528_1 /TAXON_ID=43686 ORGANISM="Pelagodinium beii, Strain RCC1491" /NCGR_SAMPLE_ID=MMETSP1338 /ASSEMBLY_ACC=CAM_ASM_000754 /LENGTH=101 /DNA_ID=CAMNT_0043200927 /DNA_START=488 /DNA_END=794 /DNA_ORIENTATION=+